ncbi:unnamed protein product [Durusdinium trenchii]|uniref:Uncharacterized protein n=2 Tax=Durusdinium trenchii TaxID=1381693 RepID=A0ABP0HF67_9DINO
MPRGLWRWGRWDAHEAVPAPDQRDFQHALHGSLVLVPSGRAEKHASLAAFLGAQAWRPRLPSSFEEVEYMKVDCDTGKVKGFLYGPRGPPVTDPSMLPYGQLPGCLPGEKPECEPDDDNPFCQEPPPPPPSPPPADGSAGPVAGFTGAAGAFGTPEEPNAAEPAAEGAEAVDADAPPDQPAEPPVQPPGQPLGQPGQPQAQPQAPAAPLLSGPPLPALPPLPRKKCIPGEEIPTPMEPCQIKQGLCCHKCRSRADCKLCLEWKEVLGQIPVDIDRKGWAQNICPPPSNSEEADDQDLEEEYLVSD